ncbi:Acyl-CoA thioesterase [Halopseudomonas sabulinigri]|uniref:Acyl-CoA thioesterase n=1 Tax=Halopseudomonas sabulinigri TaxID=472181 RepID=A0A1H1UK64_9GAMM|nr:thioesterase family protein [Halopseudomonas sabulinigri]SDS72843.1 Acyl-CoA thioesterase [Halopseudomonas sabulinigri]
MTTTLPASHAFDRAIALQPLATNLFSGATSDDYQNMVGPFGGVTAATLLNAVLQHPERIGEPVSLTINFAGPVQPGAFEIEATPLRTNRSTQHWLLLQRQGGEVVTSGTAFFATRRETWSEQQESMPAAPAADSLPQQIRQERSWFQHYDFRYVTGLFHPKEQIKEGREGTESLLWARDNPPRPLDFASLTALGDVFAPRIFHRRQRFTPAGTVSLTHYFHADAAHLAASGDRPLLGQARATRMHNNYSDQVAHLWSEDGVLLLTSTQVAYYKE